MTYPDIRRGKTKKSKAKEEEAAAAAQAAAHAASLSAQENGHVKIYSISGTGTISERSSGHISLPAHEKPLKLFSGPLLGITTNKSILRGQQCGRPPPPPPFPCNKPCLFLRASISASGRMVVISVLVSLSLFREESFSNLSICLYKSDELESRMQLIALKTLDCGKTLLIERTSSSPASASEEQMQWLLCD